MRRRQVRRSDRRRAMDPCRYGTRRTQIARWDHDRAWTALAFADPDAHSGDHRAEGREKHAELRRQLNSLSHSDPRRLAVTWPREVIAAEDVPPNALRVTYKVTIEIDDGKPPPVSRIIAKRVHTERLRSLFAVNATDRRSQIFLALMKCP